MLQTPEPLIQIRDQQDILSFRFDNLVKYHGRFNIGGAAMAFRVLAEGFARRSPGADHPGCSIHRLVSDPHDRLTTA